MADRRPPRKKPAAKRGPAAKPRKKPAGRKAATRKPAPARAAAVAAPAETAAPAFAASAGDEQWTFRHQLKRLSLKDRPTQIAAGTIALIIILIAAIAAWPGSSTKTSEVASGGEVADSSGDNLGGGGLVPTTKGEKSPGSATGAGSAARRAQDRVTLNPEVNRAFAQQVASKIKPQSSSLPNGNPNTWAGVSRDTIKAVFSYDKSNCGVNLINAISAAGAQFGTSTRYYRAAAKNQDELNARHVESVNILVKLFNARGWEAGMTFPQLRPVLQKYGTPSRPFYGRRLVHQMIDGGSFQCPERTNAAAVRIVQEIKPFVVYNNFDGAQYEMADALNAKAPPNRRPMHFGTLWLSDRDYTRWAPFAWTQFNSGTRGGELYMSWACSRLVGRNATNAPDYKGTKRKFALLYPNLPAAAHVAAEYKALSKKYCGTNIYEGREIAYAPDPSRAADEGTSIAVRLKLDGVTTLTYVMDPVFPIFQMVQFQSQDYQPELAWTPSGYYDSNTVQRIYMSLGKDWFITSFGVTQFGVPGGFGFGAGDPFYAYHDTHKKSPKTGKACDPSSDAGMNHDETYCKAPGELITWYYTTLASLGGVLFAGPDLTPAHLSRGLQSYPKIRYGGAGPTNSPHPAQLGSGPGKFYFVVDGTEYKWRGDFVSPPPESKIGFVTYPDCERHYNLWPDKLAVNWERSGPNYNKYCGDAKYAPSPYRPSASSGQNCADDAAGGVCRKDGYPRWQDY